MLPIIAWIIIIIAILIIFFIVAGKLPALALLDINNITSEKEARFKDQIMRQKVERDLNKLSSLIGRIYLFISRQASKFIKSAQIKLKKIKLNYKSLARIPALEKTKLIERLLAECEDFCKREEWNFAEDKLLEIINLDQKNLSAFLKLANLYDEQKKWLEARQTYEYSLKLARQAIKNGDRIDILIQEIYFSLAVSARRQGDVKLALDSIREALEYEPSSPRYLDLILDLSIIGKDKELAQVYLEKLAAVNPDNKKLSEWQDKINDLS